MLTYLVLPLPSKMIHTIVQYDHISSFILIISFLIHNKIIFIWGRKDAYVTTWFLLYFSTILKCHHKNLNHSYIWARKLILWKTQGKLLELGFLFRSNIFITLCLNVLICNWVLILPAWLYVYIYSFIFKSINYFINNKW